MLKSLFLLAVLIAGCSASSDMSVEVISSDWVMSALVDVDRSSVQVSTLHSWGSGTVLDQHWVLTAGHVVAGEPACSIQRVSRDSAWSRACIVKFVDAEADLALLYSPKPIERRPSELADGNVKCYQKVISCGFPLAMFTPTITEGRVQEDSDGHLRVTADGFFGSSGGGIFCWVRNQYVLCGVVQRIGVSGRGQALTYIIYGANIADINSFIRHANSSGVFE